MKASDICVKIKGCDPFINSYGALPPDKSPLNRSALVLDRVHVHCLSLRTCLTKLNLEDRGLSADI